MKRKTRSGHTFSVWEGPAVLSENPNFDLERLVRDATDLETTVCDESAPTPVDYPPIGSVTSDMAAAFICPDADGAGHSRTEPTLSDDGEDAIDSALSPSERRKRQRKRQAAQAARAKCRKRAAADDYTHYKPRANFDAKFVHTATPITSDKDLSKSKVVKTAYTALSDQDKDLQEYALEELVGPNSKYGFRYVPWDGSTPTPVLSPTGVLTAVLVGCPDDAKWPQLKEEAVDLLKSAAKNVTTKEDDLVHRRGAFVALPCGVSHGGGQLKPSNLGSASKTNEKIIADLNKSDPFKRIAGYTNSAMATWAPKLYEYYGSHMSALYKHDDSLVPIFPRSVFAAASYNLGPRTVCFPHKDFANLPFGWCAVTALGHYNPTTGGHMVLWDCGLVIEFPPGATILLPSATVTHSNTSVDSTETRFSFAQYTAGAIFRWVDNGFQRSVDYHASIKDDEVKWKKHIEKDKGRWAFGLSLLPVFRIPETADAL